MTNTEEPSLETLTPRDREVVSLIMAGQNNREISEQLNLHYQTIRNRVSQIYKKLKVNKRTGLIVWVMKNGYDKPSMLAPWLEIEGGDS